MIHKESREMKPSNQRNGDNDMYKYLGLTIVAIAVAVAPASAAFLTDWGAGDVVHITDPTGDASHLSRDITNLYTRSSGGVLYFRMDLGLAPVQIAGQYAPEYAIQIDMDNSQGGGPNPAVGGSNYIAEDVGIEIDTLFLSHYTLGSAWTVDHRHVYQGPTTSAPRVDTTMLGTLGGVFDSGEGGGTILQWAIPYSELVYLDYDGSTNEETWVGDITFYGTTQSIDDPDTFDTTEGVTVNIPEPTTMSLLALGGIAALKRRKK
jgi:hypothetical protein